MDTIVFNLRTGETVAVLSLSRPVAPTRHCIFVVAASEIETYRSRESEVLLPERSREYSCSYLTGAEGTIVEFENQNGWRVRVRLNADEQGEWSATNGPETLSGVAISARAEIRRIEQLLEQQEPR